MQHKTNSYLDHTDALVVAKGVCADPEMVGGGGDVPGGVVRGQLLVHEPSRLPGWTRAHVASHIARNADGLIRSIEALLSDRPTLMYDGDEERDWAVERGSQRGGLDLQIDLDTTAGRLNTAFNQLEELAPDTPVELRPQHRLRADLLPLARLNEVVLHTIHTFQACAFDRSAISPGYVM